MLLGVATGLFFRRFSLSWLQFLINILIWLLLFLLGLEVGGNKHIIDGFAELGIEAILIGSSAVIGSVVASALFMRWLTKKKGQNIK